MLNEVSEFISAGLNALPAVRAGVDFGLKRIDLKGGISPIIRAAARTKVDRASELDPDDHPNFKRNQSAPTIAMAELLDFNNRLKDITNVTDSAGHLSSYQPPARKSGRGQPRPDYARPTSTPGRTLRVKGVSRILPAPADRDGQRRRVYSAPEFFAVWRQQPISKRAALVAWAISTDRVPVKKTVLYEKRKRWVEDGSPTTVQAWAKVNPTRDLTGAGWGSKTGRPPTITKQKAVAHLEKQKDVIAQSGSIKDTRRLSLQAHKENLDERGVTLAVSDAAACKGTVANDHAYLAAQDGTGTLVKTAKTTQAR